MELGSGPQCASMIIRNTVRRLHWLDIRKEFLIPILLVVKWMHGMYFLITQGHTDMIKIGIHGTV